MFTFPFNLFDLVFQVWLLRLPSIPYSMWCNNTFRFETSDCWSGNEMSFDSIKTYNLSSFINSLFKSLYLIDDHIECLYLTNFLASPNSSASDWNKQTNIDWIIVHNSSIIYQWTSWCGNSYEKTRLTLECVILLIFKFCERDFISPCEKVESEFWYHLIYFPISSTSL